MNDMKTMQKELLNWYEKNARELSFRKDRDAYKIWVSEIMAQQTRIDAMLPYFDRFLQAFPNIEALANADDEALHKLWQGLGYYSRCRNMKKSAKICMERFGGKLPASKEQLKTLPGIGDYTAGAIASIAFREKVSAIDGNVIRVFARLYDIHDDVTKAKTKRHIEALVEASLVEPIELYNQALMELGALVCIPKSPKCLECPIRLFCKTREPEVLPIRKEKKKRRVERKKIYIWVYDGMIHLHKRNPTGLLANLYEFDEGLPASYLIQEEIGSYTHVFSHVEWQMDASIVFCNEIGDDFYSIDEIENSIALPSAFQPFYKKVKEVLQYEKD